MFRATCNALTVASRRSVLTTGAQRGATKQPGRTLSVLEAHALATRVLPLVWRSPVSLDSPFRTSRRSVTQASVSAESMRRELEKGSRA